MLTPPAEGPKLAAFRRLSALFEPGQRVAFGDLSRQDYKDYYVSLSQKRRDSGVLWSDDIKKRLLARTLDIDDFEGHFKLREGAEEAFETVQKLMEGDVAGFNALMKRTRKIEGSYFKPGELFYGLDFSGLDLRGINWRDIVGVDLTGAALDTFSVRVLNRKQMETFVLQESFPEGPLMSIFFCADEIERIAASLQEGEQVETGSVRLPEPFDPAVFRIQALYNDKIRVSIKLNHRGDKAVFEKQDWMKIFGEQVVKVHGGGLCYEIDSSGDSKSLVIFKDFDGLSVKRYSAFLKKAEKILTEMGRLYVMREKESGLAPFSLHIPNHRAVLLNFDPRFADVYYSSSLDKYSKDKIIAESKKNISSLEPELSLSDVVLSYNTKTFLADQVLGLRGFPDKTLADPFVLFHGDAGVGKTLLAKLMAALSAPRNSFLVKNTAFLPHAKTSEKFTALFNAVIDYTRARNEGYVVVVLDDVPYTLLNGADAPIFISVLDRITDSKLPIAVFATHAPTGKNDKDVKEALGRPGRLRPIRIRRPGESRRVELLEFYWKKKFPGEEVPDFLKRKVEGDQKYKKVWSTPAEIAEMVEASDPGSYSRSLDWDIEI